jgi:uncharacterized protein
MKTENNLLVPMRDGTILRCDLRRPDGESPLPAILMRTPYGKEKVTQEKVYDCYDLLTGAGYNVVIMDVRGTGASDGILKSSGESEYADGYDTVEWVAAQPWCNGNVGMYGLSYFGFSQHAAASLAPPHLKAYCPFQNSALLPFSGNKVRAVGGLHLFWLYGQALNRLEWNGWPAEKTEAVRQALLQNMQHMPELLLHLPLRETPAADVEGVPLLRDFIELVDGLEDDAWWHKIHHPTDFHPIQAAMFHLTGWFDLACDGTIGNYHEARTACRPEVAQTQKLVIGPWGHGGGLSALIDGVDFGEANSGEGQRIPDMMLAWFDYWLKGIDNGILAQPAVRYFVLGANIWRGAEHWPPADSVVTPWYLHSDGQARTLNGTGRLSVVKPGAEASDSFIYDPAKPFPANWKDEAGHMVMADQCPLELRDDVLVYTSDELAAGLEVSGSVHARVFASSSAPDTDFTCRLLDVLPDGSAHALKGGLVRAKFRDGTPARLIEPGQVYEYDIELGNISVFFPAGHRIRVEISSSLYPDYDRNLNTGEPLGQGRVAVPANQQVWHSGAAPSAILLPIRR